MSISVRDGVATIFVAAAVYALAYHDSHSRLISP